MLFLEPLGELLDCNGPPVGIALGGRVIAVLGGRDDRDRPAARLLAGEYGAGPEANAARSSPGAVLYNVSFATTGQDADGGYQGPEFNKALAKILPHLETEIIKRSDHAKGFVVLPRRWLVERTIAWLNRCRRLAKDWENLNRKALAFLRLASIRLMLRKLCNPA